MARSARRIVLAAIALAVVASAFAIGPARADTESFTFYGDAVTGWGATSGSISSPGPHITVTQGDLVALTLHSADGALHNWFVDYNNNSQVDTAEPSSANFSGTTAAFFNFTAARVGTFWYKCRFHTLMMIGQITVQTPPTFELYGSMTAGWGFTASTLSSPGPTMTVNQGDTVTIDLTSADGAAHTLVIDYNNNSAEDAGEPVSPVFSGTTTVRFTFTADRAGVFQYYCGLHGSAIMKGTIIVRGSTTTPPSGDNTVLIIGGVIIVVAVVAVAAAMMMRRKKPT